MNKYQARFIESVLKKVIDSTYTKSKACVCVMCTSSSLMHLSYLSHFETNDISALFY